MKAPVPTGNWPPIIRAAVCSRCSLASSRRRRKVCYERKKPMTQAILCLSRYFKGAAFLQACKEAGLHVILATNEKNKDESWPRQHIDEFFHMPDLGKLPNILHAAAYLAR